MKVDLSETQEQALRAAKDLLGEHFDASLIVVTTELEEKGKPVDCSHLSWSGGYMSAIGLAEYAKRKLLIDRDHNYGRY